MAPKKPLPSPPLKDDQKLSSKKQPDEEDSSEEETEEDQPDLEENEETQAQTKRAAENGNDSNRSKKKKTIAVAASSSSDDENETEEDVKLTGEDSKKSNQRIFSEQDELTILKGLAEFILKTQTYASIDGPAFHRFVKESLHAECNVQQLMRKVRGLKNKYETSDSFTKPHDKKAFELFKKVWGNDGAFKKVWGNDGANEAEEKGKVNGKMVKGVRKEASGSVKKATEKETVKVESDADMSLILTELFRFDAAGLSASSKDLMKRGLELMEESKRAEFEEKWRQVQIAELELFKKRSQVVTDCSNLILQAINKSSK